ncbi:flippase [Marinobacter similis]|uniref:Transporter n=1 Tax=Marinobacter similis TaxID=1420916 RepID=W5YRL9_9GAMM|nr:flippase [Marinobacter similis]AHI29133.1 transporter [Marinobacter similis]
MFRAFKDKLANTTEKRTLTSNIFSLGILQGANYLLPLLTIPYLVRVLGPEYFGLVAFATATIGYFSIITDYGFNLSATRLISIHRNNQVKINQIFNAVMQIKAFLMLLSFVFLLILIRTFEKFSDHWELYLLTFGVVLGQVLFPVWLFQGMERMKYIAYVNIAAKAFFTVFIFLFVRNKDDILFVPTLTSLGFIVAGVWSLHVARREFGISFAPQSWREIRFQLIDGWHVFISSISISLYTISTTFILGIFTNNIIVGYFSAADKIIQAVKGIYKPFSQAIFPLISKKIQSDRQEGLFFAHNFAKLAGGAMLIMSLALFSMAEIIVNLLLGEQYQQSVALLKIMAFLPFIVTMSNIYGVQIMLNLGYKKAFTRILIIAALVGVMLSLILVPVYEDIGTSVTLLIVESMVTIFMFLYLKFWQEEKC